MTRLASALVVVGVGLSVFGMGEGDASATLTGPGIYGIAQGAMCRAELDSSAGNVSYYAGNGGLLVSTATTWVQCPVNDVTGLISTPTGALVYAMNTGSSASTCYLHRVSYTSGAIVATTTVSIPTGTTSVTAFSLAQPSLTGNFYSLECSLVPGATLMGYYVNMAN